MKQCCYSARPSFRFWAFVTIVVAASLATGQRLAGRELAGQVFQSQQDDQTAAADKAGRRQSIEETLAEKKTHRKASRSAIFGRNLAELHLKAQQQGMVRIIVGVKANHQPEGELASLQAVEEQRAAIAQAQQSFLEHLASYNPDTVKRFETIPFLALEVDQAMLERIRDFEEIVSIEEDALMKPTLAESAQIIGATAAWARGFSGSGQTIAILDTGVDKAHFFLTGKVVSEACYSTNSSVFNSNSVCPNGATETTAIGSGINCSSNIRGCDHGTHVAGIAAGRGSSFSGIARDANLISIQVFSRFNSNSDCDGAAPCVLSYVSDQVKGLERVYALRNSFNIAAVNMSLGGGRFVSQCDADHPATTAAINNLRSVGIATVIASGNDGFTNAVGAPACISSAISVGSTNDGGAAGDIDTISNFSNSATFLNLLAPGNSINSSVPNNRFLNFSGTSMAAPHAAGAFAVLRSAAPNTSVTQILSALTSTGKSVTDARNGIVKPRIRIDASLDALLNANCTYSISPLSQSFPANGGNNTISVNATSNCSWQAVSNANWIVINSGVTGNGNGQVVYSVQANSSANSRTGSLTVAGRSFTVTQTGSGADPCAATIPINFGQSLTGTLANGDCQLSDGSYVDFYSFSASAGQQIAVTMDSTAFDTFLILFSPEGSVIAHNDDSGGSTNSRLPAEFGFLTAPTSGTYLIGANSFRAGEAGNYTLRLAGQSGCHRAYYVDATNNGVNQWLDTGFDAVSGQPISLTATGLSCLLGQRCFGPNGELNSNPSGEFRFAELIGKIGVSGQAFRVGANFQQNATATGRLYLAVYDSFYPDNSGGFNVCLSSCSGTKLNLPSSSAPSDGQTNVGTNVNVGGVSLSRVTLSWALNSSNSIADSWLTIRDLSTNRIVFNQNLGAAQSHTIDLQPNSQYRWGVKAVPKSSTHCISDEVFRTFTTSVAQCSSGNFLCEQFNNSPSQGTLNGSAGYDSANRELRLTSSQFYQAGSFFFTPTTLIDRFTASFQIRIDGQGADGMTFAVIEAGANSLGRTGSGLGYENIPGRSFALEFDNFFNQEYDPPTTPHLGLNVNGDMQSVTTVGLPPFQSQGNLTVRVVFDRGTVEVFLPASHSAPAMRATIPNWTPFTGRFGFTAATGGLAQIHTIDSVVIAEQSCTFTLSPPSQNFSASANLGGVSVATQSGCAWTATSNASWISITSGASGVGNGVVGYSITANNTGAQRIGTLTIAGQTVTITQSACTFALSPTSQSFGTGLGTGGFSITTQTGCAWSAISNDSWITITSASSGTGLGSVAYNVTANSGPQRMGTISVAGQTFTVTQAGQSCTYSISPTSLDVTASGGNGSINVTAGSGCNWTATSNATFITINSGANGSGSGTVGFTVAANTSANSRNGTLTIAGLTLTVTQAGATNTNRLVRAAQATGSPGGTVSLPIELLSQGDETALGFSLTFDPAVLSNPQATLGADASGASLNTNSSQIAQGRFGVALSLPSGQRFTAGTRQIVAVSFSVAANANAGATPVGFGDQPIAREISDTAANSLPANYVAGAIAIAQGYEADVAPRPNGNGSVTVTDWVQIGRFVAGTDTLQAGNEFQRADVAPRSSAGDGRLTITDWVQAGRYAAGQDPLTPAGGPTTPTSSIDLFSATAPNVIPNRTSRALRVRQTKLEREQTGDLVIELNALGNENALGFSLSFDPAQLRFISARLGNDAAGATLNLNANQIHQGHIGVALALPAGKVFAIGEHQILALTFSASTDGNPAITPVHFQDHPVLREFSDSQANVLAATYSNGAVQLTRTVTSVSAASFGDQSLAPESLATAFGVNLATGVAAANNLPLPTSLLGTTVKVRDSAGIERLAPLFFVAPSQVNYQIPPGTAPGLAQITVISADGHLSNGQAEITPVAPGLLSVNANGQGVATSIALRIKANGEQSYDPLARFDAATNSFVPLPLDLGPPTDQVFLIVFGTGIRGRRSLERVAVQLGGTPVPVIYAGAQGDFVGLDQINLGPVPRSLIGRGDIEIGVLVEGRAANPLKLNIR